MKFKTNLMLLAASVVILWMSVTAAFSEGTGAVIVDVDADTPLVHLETNRKAIVRVLVRPDPAKAPQKKRAPLAVALVLDKSGSMSSNQKMENAKLGALQALKMLDPRDIATVVVYDSSAHVLVKPRTLDKMDTFTNAIRRIEPSGSTALYDGVRVGAEQLRPFVKDGYIPRIILLSDGMANVGPSSTEELASFGRSLAAQEMTITTIGLGLDYNEDLMTALAAKSGGNSYFAQDADRLPEIFARDMEDAVTLTARKVLVRLRGDNGVRPIKALGREGRLEGTTLEASIDNLYGSEKYALFEVELPERQDTASFEAATVTLEYVDASTGAPVVRTVPLKLTLASNTEEVTKNRRNDIVAQAALAQNSEIREEVVRLTDEGKTEEAAQVLKAREKDLRQMAPSAGAEAPKLESEARAFDELASELTEQKVMPSAARKQVLNEAYIQKNQQSTVDSK